jgi:ATP-binding cassette subfamily F protein uup
MPHLILSNASLAFGDIPLLDRAEFQLDAGERVALIGRNGTGKSSLLCALAGQGGLDEGEVWRQPGLRLGYVPQEPPFEANLTVFQAVVAGMGELSTLLGEYHAVSHALGEEGSDQAALLERMQTLQSALEARHAWSFEAQAEKAIQRLSLDAEALVGTLSGGQKKRLALAQALAVSPEVLLLDEPTNHLDLAAIEWLEDMLVASGVTLLFVTHDRRFLERVATRIVELDRGRLLSFPGSFSGYQARKEAMLHDEALSNARFDKFLAQEEVWIRQGIKARRTRNEGRVLRLERLRRERAARRERQGKVDLALDAGTRSGKLVAVLEGVSKRFGDKVVVRDFSCRLQRGDKVGIIGPNGAGKTTLLRLLLGQLAPDQGSVHLGTKVQVAYFDQFRAALDESAALVDVISPGGDYVDIGGQKKHVISYLGDFLFPPQRARAPVSSLSGGERNRLLLARLFARPANVLVLDEPTNDLDIETLELLEELLQDYPGTLFLVSHDRTFLDNVVTQTLAPEGDGLWREYAGGYQDWADYQSERRRQESPAPTAANKRGAAPPSEAARPSRQKASSPAKLSWKEARELAELPSRIAALEAEQRAVSEQLADPLLYRSQALEVQRLSARLNEIDDELLTLLERWEALEA